MPTATGAGDKGGSSASGRPRRKLPRVFSVGVSVVVWLVIGETTTLAGAANVSLAV